MTTEQYERLTSLKLKIANKTATSDEKNEFMLILLTNGSITQQQYDDFKANYHSEEIFNIAITIASIILITWLLTKLVSE